MDWLKARKKLLDMVRGQVDSRLGSVPHSISRYAKARDREFKKKWKKRSFAQFQKRLVEAQLILLGDFHAYHQSQRGHMRLLRRLSLQGTAVFCEFLRSKDQKHVDAFFANGISEAEFLKRVRWFKEWEFPWEHYRPLLLFLKEQGVRVFGLSPGKDWDTHLKRRDEAMAKVVAKRLERESFERSVVIVGDMHLASVHLPKELRKRLGGNFSKPVVVFQDVDELYFRGAKNNITTESLVLQRGDQYCWFVSPPWVKWQSYLMFLEKTADRDLDDEDDLALEDHIKALVLWIAKDFDRRVSTNAIEVRTPMSTDRIRSTIPPKILRLLVQTERSFLWSGIGQIYLSRVSVNHGAALAGQYIHAQLSHRQRTWFESSQDLYGRLWIELVGFFFSKWINPQRKAENFEDLKIRLETLASKKAWRDTLKLVSEMYLLGQKIKRTGRCSERELVRLKKMAKDIFSFMEGCRYLGRILGKNLFEAVHAGHISKEELAQWLEVPLESEDFEQFFWKVVVPRLV